MRTTLAAVIVLALLAAPAAPAGACERAFSVRASGLKVTYRALVAGRVRIVLVRGQKVVARGGRRSLAVPRRLRGGRYALLLRAGAATDRVTVVKRARRLRVVSHAGGRCPERPFVPPDHGDRPPAPAPPPDPGATGPHDVEELEYDAGPALMVSRAPDGPSASPQKLQGAIYLSSAPGPRPLVVLLHGKHQTCEIAGGVYELLLAHPCADTPATADIRSYRGYAYLGRSLASNGYVVVSIDANGINSYDYADVAEGHLQRAELLAQSLDLLNAWNAGPGPESIGTRLVGRIDLGRIGMMGHSRGGEGVTAFIEFNRARTDGPRYPGLRAVLALAPTDFNDHTPHGVAFGALLPLCDGDVADLDGARTYDRGRFAGKEPRVQYTVTGANHNYFNSVWVENMWADDHYVRGTADSACSEDSPTSVRLKPADQQAVGLALMSGFMRRHVGGEMRFDDVVRGAAPLRSIAPLVGISTLAGPDDRLLAGDLIAAGVEMSTCTPDEEGAGCPTVPTRSIAEQRTLRWKGDGSVRAPVGGDVSAMRALTFRTATNYGETDRAADFEVVLEDAAGTRRSVAASDFTGALRIPPGDATRELTLNGAWIPLEAFAGVDLRRVAAIELRFTGSGSVQLAELGFQR